MASDEDIPGPPSPLKWGNSDEIHERNVRNQNERIDMSAVFVDLNPDLANLEAQKHQANIQKAKEWAQIPPSLAHLQSVKDLVATITQRLEKVRRTDYKYPDKARTKSEAAFDNQFSKLEAFVKENGFIHEKPIGDKELITFMKNQTTRLKDCKMPLDQLERLESIGFCWDVNTQKFLHNVDNYLALTDSTRPWMESEVAAVNQWVSHMRHQRFTMDQARFDVLDSVDFPWNSDHEKFHKYMKQLLEFRKKYGHFNIPSELPQLVQFRQGLVLEYLRGKSRLSPEDYSMLVDLGFPFENTRDARWKLMLNATKAWIEEENYPFVPVNAIQDGLPIGVWSATNRNRAKRNELTQNQLSDLKAINFCFDATDLYTVLEGVEKKDDLLKFIFDTPKDELGGETLREFVNRLADSGIACFYFGITRLARFRGEQYGFLTESRNRIVPFIKKDSGEAPDVDEVKALGFKVVWLYEKRNSGGITAKMIEDALQWNWDDRPYGIRLWKSSGHGAHYPKEEAEWRVFLTYHESFLEEMDGKGYEFVPHGIIKNYND